MSDRQPTEAQWRLIGEAMLACNTCVWMRYSVKTHGDRGSFLFYDLESELSGDISSHQFVPHVDHNDLARLVEAMQGAGYVIRRHHSWHGYTLTEVWIDGWNKGDCMRSTDLEATPWAIIEALEAKEKQDADG